ncbi:MAG: YeeE/YedE family protein [Chromatiales bacterium]|nr:MAG: YeeE/YedE family protein [Chromatiales bacterium]
MARDAAALLAGTLFGAGLTVSQMINPRKVLAFLDLAGDWDPSLAFTMGGALLVTAIGYRFVLRRPGPAFDEAFRVPPKRAVDGRLVTGAALFGIGWGLGGYCPGPALSAVAMGTQEPWIFIVAMAAGGWLGGRPWGRR